MVGGKELRFIQLSHNRELRFKCTIQLSFFSHVTHVLIPREGLPLGATTSADWPSATVSALPVKSVGNRHFGQ
ncbi:hypothetical protein IscW_ISCW003480 [Ixodes scapularis]|uniref:Uncharacterized protein n=1 Tax=Ixodes scapularis TaxID=6945 RepID=B7PH34_IXOSC|nr:hypothetical protein IscW_ISCW003480 [Ixodes scapularis]|eukprot:XP_002402032.1 hypothetical protein IscW_ISCW003480 [Ixodes scapularis]